MLYGTTDNSDQRSAIRNQTVPSTESCFLLSAICLLLSLSTRQA